MAAIEKNLFDAIERTTAHTCIVLPSSAIVGNSSSSAKSKDAMTTALCPYMPVPAVPHIITAPMPFYPGQISMPYIEFVVRYSTVLAGIRPDVEAGRANNCTKSAFVISSDDARNPTCYIHHVPIEIISMIFSHLNSLDMLMGKFDCQKKV